ncbi:MAG: trigger factor [Pseudomonadota bacterium]
MEVQVETPGGLLRQLKVSIPSERVERAVDERIKKLAGRVKIAGFRPGKAPLKVVQSQYADAARMEVISDLVRGSYPEAIGKAGVNPASQPSFEITGEKPGAPLEYTARFEVYPEIKLMGLDTLKIEKPVVTVTDTDVDKLIENMRKARRTFVSAARAAKTGDTVKVDFEGKLDGEAFSGGKGEGVDVEIGAGRMLPDLDNSFVGKSAGDVYNVDVKFPEDYRAENLKGKTAQFEVKVKEVSEPKLPELDAEFLKAHNVDEAIGVQGLRDKCRKALETERDKAVKNRIKTQVLDQLLVSNPVEVPQAMAQQEIQRLREETASRFNAAKLKADQLQKMIPDEMLAPNATRRVALGLLIGEVIKSKQIQLDAARVQTMLDSIAADYEQPEQVRQFYRGRQDLMQGLHAMVLEEQVVEVLIAGTTPTEKPLDLDTLLNPSTNNP